MRRKLAILMLFAAVALLVVAALRWRSAGVHIQAMEAERTALGAQLDTTRTDLYKTSLRYQGFLKGGANMPDSVRKAEAGRTMEQTKVYRKSIMTLEDNEKRFMHEIAKLEESIAATREGRRRALLPAALGGAALLVAGAALLALARARRVAP